MHIINERLATHGLESQLNSQKSSSQPDKNGMIDGYKVIDIRGWLNDAPTPSKAYRWFVQRAGTELQRYGKIVICSSAGVSRSNAIAVGVLMKFFGMSFEEAISLIKEKVPIADPMPCHLEQIARLERR